MEGGRAGSAGERRPTRRPSEADAAAGRSGNRGRPQARRPGSREIFSRETPPSSAAHAHGGSPAPVGERAETDPRPRPSRCGPLCCRCPTLGCACVSNAGGVTDGQDHEGTDRDPSKDIPGPRRPASVKSDMLGSYFPALASRWLRGTRVPLLGWRAWGGGPGCLTRCCLLYRGFSSFSESVSVCYPHCSGSLGFTSAPCNPPVSAHSVFSLFGDNPTALQTFSWPYIEAWVWVRHELPWPPSLTVTSQSLNPSTSCD